MSQVWQQASVRLVKDATLAGDNAKTIGQAFDGKFPDGKWTSFVNAQKVTVVEFDGTVTADAMAAAGVPGIVDEENRLRPEVLAQCVGGVHSPCRVREKFQFLLSADRSSFEIGATETVPKDSKAVLDFVYR